MEESQQNTTFDSLEEKLSESKGNWLWDAKLPDCSIIHSDDDESGVSHHSGASGGVVAAPSKNMESMIASSHLHTPHRMLPDLPFSACNESPIRHRIYSSSTPFHGQRVVSVSSTGSEQNRLGSRGNETFDKVQTPNSSLQAIVPPEISANRTFQVSQNVAATGNITFDANPAGIGTGNLTFAKENSMQETPMVVDEVGDDVFKCASGDSSSTTTPAGVSDKGFNSDMESCAKSISSDDSSSKPHERKPLKSIPQPKAGSAIPKKNDAKKSSKIALPRMNAAAISRIQARSPQSRPQSADSESKKQVFKKPLGTVSSRRSLLPASTTASKLPASTTKSRVRKPLAQAEKPKVEPMVTPTKRKAPESPKRLGREPKVPGKPASAPPLSTSLQTPRTLQKSSNLKGPSTYTRTCTKGFGSGPPLRVSSARPTQRRLAGTKKQAVDIQTEGNIRPGVKAKKLPPKESQCHVALAILLDYAVNKMNGLSTPHLRREIDQLKGIINENERDKGEMLAVTDELRVLLKTEQERACEYQQEVDQCRHSLGEYKQLVDSLQSRLENTHFEYNQKISQLEIEKNESEAEFAAKLKEVEERWESECRQLKEEIETTVQTQVEERMKPYISARSEVESMTAVLEMKNDTIRKLETKCASMSSQQDDMQLLGHKVDQLTQKNEDLSTQLQDKTEEFRQLMLECDKLQQSFSDERNTATKLRQHNEELLYRIDSASPSPSPFNPVFTTSPPDVFNTPRDHRSLKKDRQKPRLLSYQSNDDATDNDNTV